MKIIAIEGIDGSGKTHQFNLLRGYLTHKGYRVESLEFPNYSNIVGREIGKFLSGDNEVNANTLDPRSMALWFAVDRKVTFQTREEQSSADFLLLNRYTLSSAVYQVLRAEESERDEILDWILELEHTALRLPTPDIYLIMDVKIPVAQHNILKKEQREYLKDKKKDVYESSDGLLEMARNYYMKGSEKFSASKIIDCSDDLKMFDDKLIASRIQGAIQSLLPS